MTNWKVWVSCALLATFASAADAAKLQAQEVDLGEINSSFHRVVPVKVSNNTDKPVAVRGVEAIFSRDKVKYPASIGPGETAVFEIEANLALDSGVFRRTYHIFTDRDEKLDTQIVLSGYAWSFINTPQREFDLGTVDLLEPLKTLRWEIPQQTESKLAVTEVLSSPDFIDARIVDDGKAVAITPKAGIPLGAIVTRLVVRLKDVDGAVTDTKIELRGNALGQVAPNANLVTFGLFQGDKAQETRIVLTDRKQQPLRIQRVEASAGISKAVARECVKPDKACREIDVSVAPGGKTGMFNEDVKVYLEGGGQPVKVLVTGMRVKPGTQVVDLKDGKKDQKEPEGGASAAVSNQPLIAQMRKAAAPDPVLEAEPGTGPLLKWQVEDERQAYGYVIFRADAESGPFLRVSRPIIKRISEESQGASYQWRDRATKAGSTYWYYIATVYTDGHRERLSPIIKKTVSGL
jgi:Protein of unknown function (DUF1573)